MTASGQAGDSRPWHQGTIVLSLHAERGIVCSNRVRQVCSSTSPRGNIASCCRSVLHFGKGPLGKGPPFSDGYRSIHS